MLLPAYVLSNEKITTIMNIIYFWLIEIPLVWLLAVSLNMVLHNASISIVIAELLLTVIALMLFKLGKMEFLKCNDLEPTRTNIKTKNWI